MPATSKAQQQAAAIALHAPKSELRGASKQMANSMSAGELRKFASTRRKGLPKHQPESLADLGRLIMKRVLSEEDETDMGSPEERQEVIMARNILSAVQRLQGNLDNPTPDQQHSLTTIRAAARSLLQMHGSAP
jgi:hypothetical protein